MVLVLVLLLLVLLVLIGFVKMHLITKGSWSSWCVMLYRNAFLTESYKKDCYRIIEFQLVILSSLVQTDQWRCLSGISSSRVEHTTQYIWCLELTFVSKSDHTVIVYIVALLIGISVVTLFVGGREEWQYIFFSISHILTNKLIILPYK